VQLLFIEFIEGASPVLRVTGEVDVATARQLGEAIEDALAAHKALVVDMKGVTFIDAAGLRVILDIAEKLNGSGPLRLLHARAVARLLGLVGLTGIRSLELCESGEAVHG
jgi:anti-sigma B factor antagonist